MQIDKKIATLFLILTFLILSACGETLNEPRTSIQTVDIQNYNKIVGEVYDSDIPFAQDGVFYVDANAGKIVVGLKEENERTKKLQQKLKENLKTKVQFIKVEYSRSDLNRVLDELNEKSEEIATAGIVTSQVGIRTSEQKVRFVFRSFDTEKIKKEKEAIAWIEGLVEKKDRGALDIVYEPEFEAHIDLGNGE